MYSFTSPPAAPLSLSHRVSAFGENVSTSSIIWFDSLRLISKIYYYKKLFSAVQSTNPFVCKKMYKLNSKKEKDKWKKGLNHSYWRQSSLIDSYNKMQNVPWFECPCVRLNSLLYFFNRDELIQHNPLFHLQLHVKYEFPLTHTHMHTVNVFFQLHC